MKTTLRSFTFVVLAIAVGMAMLAGNAQGADGPLPPEVKALVGMKIPVNAQGRMIYPSGWIILGGGVLGASSQDGKKLGYNILYNKANTNIFVTVGDVFTQNSKFLDAIVLPGQLLNYEITNGKPELKRDGSQLYNFEPSCKRGQFELIAGLMRAELGKAGCQHWTTRVKRAWLVDPITGHISEISPQGVACFYDAESICQ